MGKYLPSLGALRAFEATARHLSFTRAATELNLTQTAISHRIKELEGLLSVELFTRKQNAVTLTDDGRSYLEAIRPALAQIASATDSVSSGSENRLNITCMSAFAVKCLIPALVDFRQRNADIALRITPALVTERATLNDFDIAIWHGVNDWPGCDVTQIRHEEIFPVCAPELLVAGKGLITPADLSNYTVVRTVSPIITDEWPVWLQHAGAAPAEFGSEIYCESLYFSLSAALGGLGIGIGRTSLVEKDLAAGRLVEPFDVRVPSDSAYYVVNRSEKSALPKIDRFKTWLLDYFGNRPPLLPPA
jgi:LysR family glycine cleavage system transcriptional activator